MPELSVNRNALKLVKDLCDNPERYGVTVKGNSLKTCIIDVGIEAKGGLLAGKTVTEICLGGLGEASITSMSIGSLNLPAVTVYTDHPAVSTLGSQLAGWQVKVGEYSAAGSGPARALALKPKSVYAKIGYRDESDIAILVLETSREPPLEVITYISELCHVTPERLFLILVPIVSLAGSVQISGRIVETGIHKLYELGLDPKLITYAWGHAPILPVHPDDVEAMGRTNDAILYGGTTYYTVNYEDDETLWNLVQQSVSSSSKQYGRPFAQIFREANLDFYKIDPGIFAPAAMTVTNARSGRSFTAGTVNPDVLMRSMGL